MKLGRVLVIIGRGVTLADAVGLWATVLAERIAVSVWALAPRSPFSARSPSCASARSQQRAHH
jgi:hypothetical protein